MTAQPTGLFQGLAPLLVNRTVIMTVAADGKGLLTLNVISKKVKDDEGDALTTPLCITASPEDLDRDLAAQLRAFTDVHAKAACCETLAYTRRLIKIMPGNERPD